RRRGGQRHLISSFENAFGRRDFAVLFWPIVRATAASVDAGARHERTMTAANGPLPAGLPHRDPRMGRPSEGPPNDLLELFEKAVTLCEAGQWSDAERAFRRILGIDPRHFASLHCLGAICSQQGDHGEALALIDAALAIDAQSAAAHNSRGNVLAALKRFEEALASFDRA